MKHKHCETTDATVLFYLPLNTQVSIYIPLRAARVEEHLLLDYDIHFFFEVSLLYIDITKFLFFFKKKDGINFYGNIACRAGLRKSD